MVDVDDDKMTDLRRYGLEQTCNEQTDQKGAAAVSAIHPSDVWMDDDAYIMCDLVR